MTLDEVASSSIPLRGFEHDTETIRSAATRLRLAVEGITPHGLIGIDPESLIQLDTSAIAIEGAVEGINGEIDGATEYTKRRKLIPNALLCNDLVADLAKAEGHLDTMAVERSDKPNGPLQVRVTDAFCQWLADLANSPSLGLGSGLRHPPPSPSVEITRLPSAGALYYNPSAHNRVRSLLPRIETMRRSLRIDIWIKQPRWETCESLVRACQKAQHDLENFLAWFTQIELGLHGTGLDCYIAQVLLGMHVSGGEVRLPGDMRNLADLSEHETYATILRQARARKAADENGEQDRIPVDPPGARRSGRRFEALSRADFLEELDNLFVSGRQIETGTTMRAALIDAATREDFERLFRKVGLPRAHARFAARVASGRGALVDNPAAARAIEEKRQAIIEAMESDKFFRSLFWVA